MGRLDRPVLEKLLKQTPAKKRKPARAANRRTCLMCARPFTSDGSHNRICKRCKATQTWREGG